MIPEYRKLAASGQIEISTTPFYHPILPLLCDSDIASVCASRMFLCRRASAIRRTRGCSSRWRAITSKKTFGVAPVGLWPSEGSVSDHALEMAASVGFEWAATDNGVLDRTLRRAATPEITYRPYRWAQRGREMRMIFRDHVLSDLIGFVYSGMGAADAAQDFLHRIHDNCRPCSPVAATRWCPSFSTARTPGNTTTATAGPSSANCTGAFRHDGSMEAITVSEALRAHSARAARLTFSLAPGSTPISMSGSAPRKTTNPGGCLLDARRSGGESRARDVPDAEARAPWKKS